MEKLAKIQKELNAPKNLFNKFGNYYYRNAEGILEAVKPMLQGAILTINDEIVEVGGRVYVKATATFKDGDFVETVSAFAREEESQKGMNAAQITGSASSYARKYALNGLFLIDDVKDPDFGKHEPTEEPTKKPTKEPTEEPTKKREELTDEDKEFIEKMEALKHKPVDKSQLEALKSALIDRGADATDKMKDYFGIADLSELTKEQWAEAVRILQKPVKNLNL